MTHTDRDKLIREHVDAARRVARKIARGLRDPALREDVEAAALVGLAEAAHRYDPQNGEPFFAFAVKRVRGAAVDELRRVQVLTRREREHARRIEDAMAAVEARSGDPANTNEVADELGMHVDRLRELQARVARRAAVPYDDAVGHASTADECPAERIDRKRALARLRRALDDLARRDREVIAMYYDRSMSLREIGARLGVSESRVCQLRGRAERALRRALLERQAQPPANAGQTQAAAPAAGRAIRAAR